MIVGRANALLSVVLSGVVYAGAQGGTVGLETFVRMSDRIVLASVLSVGSGTVTLPNGAGVVMGAKDPVSGIVYTPSRIRVRQCLFDAGGVCEPAEMELSVPGGTVYETVDGDVRLRTWEITGAGGSLPAVGEDVVLFLARRGERFVVLNGQGSRIHVDGMPSNPTVRLQLESPVSLSVLGRDAGTTTSGAVPHPRQPMLVDDVPLDRLKSLIEFVRQVPRPTSRRFHATPNGTGARGSAGLQLPDCARVRVGKDGERCGSALGIGNDLVSAHRAIDARRTRGT